MKQSRLVAVCSIATALIIVLSLIPPSFGLPFFGFIPVLVVISAFRKIKISVYVSLTAGIISWIFAYIRPSVVGLAFQSNPHLAILPRLFAGLVAHYVSVFVFYISKSKIIPTGIFCAIFGSSANTLFVIGAIVIFVPEAYSNFVTTWAYVAFIIPTAILELVMNSIITPVMSRIIVKRMKVELKNTQQI
ncbi:MAG: hypothetical protein LBU60_00970 [Clostridiales bacterium]|jgi:hypothetical protein|nr:hypothetical protein [Clostridiales bacterium]